MMWKYEHTGVLVKVLAPESINDWCEGKGSHFGHGSGGGDVTDLVHDALNKLGGLAIFGKLEVHCKNCDGRIW